jgi:hypothetical protein
MKSFLITLSLLTLVTPAFAYKSVKGYLSDEGTYVAPHYRTRSDSSTLNNWSTKGNSNPFTGSAGYKAPTYRTGGSSFGNSRMGSYGYSTRRYR